MGEWWARLPPCGDPLVGEGMPHLLFAQLDSRRGDDQEAVGRHGGGERVGRGGRRGRKHAHRDLSREHTREEELQLAEGTHGGEGAVRGVLDLGAAKHAADAQGRLDGGDGGVLRPEQREPLGDPVVLLEHHRDHGAARELRGECGEEVDVAFVRLVQLRHLLRGERQLRRTAGEAVASVRAAVGVGKALPLEERGVQPSANSPRRHNAPTRVAGGGAPPSARGQRRSASRSAPRSPRRTPRRPHLA